MTVQVPPLHCAPVGMTRCSGEETTHQIGGYWDGWGQNGEASPDAQGTPLPLALLLTIALEVAGVETLCAVLYTETALAGSNTVADTVSVSVLMTASVLLFGDAT